MIVVDSCGWIELLAGSDLGRAYRPALSNAAKLIVPTVCLLEVERRLLASRGEEAADSAIAAMLQARVEPLDAPLAHEAARLGATNGLPCADSIIYAAARRYHAELWTHDSHFRGLPGVHFVEASGGE